MAYIGNEPAESYASFETETFSVSATASYTLSHAVANENEIRLVINGVVQQPGSGKAYTASGTTLTLSSATVSGDVMYAVYLGRALQTVNPPNASVGNSQTAPTIITGQTAEATIATDDTILIHDTSASALRKMTRANFVSGIGGNMSPSFFATLGSNQSISDNTQTKANINTEVYDTDSCYDASTNYRFLPTTAGKYYFYAGNRMRSASDPKSSKIISSGINLYKNGSYNIGCSQENQDHNLRSPNLYIQAVIDMNGSSDYVEVYCIADHSDDVNVEIVKCFFGGYKIIE